jgi:hypothetical protein
MLAMLTGNNAYHCFTDAFSRTCLCMVSTKLNKFLELRIPGLQSTNKQFLLKLRTNVETNFWSRRFYTLPNNRFGSGNSERSALNWFCDEGKSET